MGKAIIVKGADFSENAIGVLPELYQDITSKLVQGLGSISLNQVTLLDASYNSSNASIPKYVMLMEDSATLFDSSDMSVEFFIPSGFTFRPWVYKKTSSVSAYGKISDSYGDTSKSFTGDGSWITAQQIYTKLGVSAETYNCYSGHFSFTTPSAMSVEDAVQAGVKVRRKLSL